MADAMLHPEFETLGQQDIRAFQQKLWSAQWPYVTRRSLYYSDRLGAVADDSVSLDRLSELPFTDKEDLRQSQEIDGPFGSYVACPHEDVVRVHRTSGSTGRPLYLAHTQRDVEVQNLVGARAQFSAGLRPTHRVVHCLNFCMWTGGLTDHLTLESTGACAVPFGAGNTQLLIDTILKLQISAISCTPSYPALLETFLREAGVSPRSLRLKLGLFGGEAGLDEVEFRRALEDTWGMSARNANYGLSEILSNFASQCERTSDLHFHGADTLYAELVDGAGNSLPIKEGNTGELVCTHLRKECQPLLRYKTRDVLLITGTGVCECGRTSWRFRVAGRTDDMFNVRGVNVFPSAVQAAILSRPDIASGQFRIVLEGTGPWDRVRVKAEAKSNVRPDDFAAVAHKLELAIRTFTAASAEVTVLPDGSLPRTDGKTSLIERTQK